MRSFVLAALLASASAPAFAQASRDTLADAVASAIDNNPELMAQRQVRAGADESLEQAKAAMRPTIGFTGTYGTQTLEYGRTVNTVSGQFPLGGAQDRATVGLEARHTLYAGGALWAQRDQARAGVDAAEAELIGAEQQLVLEVVNAFVNVRRAEQEVSFRDTNVSSLKQQVQAAEDRFEVGEVTRTDVAQAEAREAAAESDLASSRAQLAGARAIYEQVVGRLPVQLAEPPPGPPLPGTVEEAITISRGSNPQLVSARAQEAGAEEGIKIARGSMAPKIGVVGNAGIQDTYLDTRFRDTNVGVTAQVTVPLYQGGLLSSRTRGARLESDRARYARMAVERQVAAQVTTAWHTAIAAREAITASTSQVAAAQIALEGAKEELAVGTRITLDVLDQETELLDAQLRLADAERASYIAHHRLLAAMGHLRPGDIGRQ